MSSVHAQTKYIGGVFLEGGHINISTTKKPHPDPAPQLYRIRRGGETLRRVSVAVAVG